jgi:hypothetical protein
MSFDENTQTTSVGSRDWLEASKGMEIRGYLPPVDTVELTTESLEQSTQFTATGYLIPVPTSGELEQEDEEFLAQLKEYHGRRFSDEW